MIIITGGAGFIGSAVIWGLNNRGVDDIVVVDHLDCDEKWKNLRELSFEDYLEKDDFRDLIKRDLIKRGRFSSDNTSAIIHMGACSSTAELNASYLVDNNYQYSKELASFAIEHNIRFVYASSAATYGNGDRGYNDDRSQLTSLIPLNMYGYSKQMFDLWAYRHNLLDKIVGLKFSNVFGPNEYHKDDMRSVPHKAFGQIQDSGKVQLFKSYKDEYNDGGQMRDFIYIKDVVDMIIFFLEKQNINGIYNIGSGKARTWKDLVTSIFSALKIAPEIEYIDMPEGLKDKYQYFTELNMDKLHKAGYSKSMMTLEKATEDYVLNYLIPDRYLSSSSKGS